MFTTGYNEKQYVFEPDRLSVNGFPILYQDMSNIAHRGGDQPAFIFDFKGKRFLLPYHPEDLRSILPYFMRAKEIAAAAQAAELAPVTEPVYVQEPEPVFEPEPYVEAEPYVEQEPYIEPATYTEPAPYVEPDPYVEQTPYVEPEPLIEPAPAVEPEVYAEPEPVWEPDVTIDPEPAAEPEVYVEPAVEPEAYTEPAPEWDDTRVLVPDAEPVVQPEPSIEAPAEPVIDSEPIVDPKADLVIEPEIEPMIDPEVEPVIDPDVEPEIESVLLPESEPAAETESEPFKLDQDPAPTSNKKGLIIKIAIGVVILAVLGAIAFFVFGSSSDDEEGVASAGDAEAEEFYDTEGDWEETPAKDGGTFEATEGFTVADADGTMDIKLKNVYLGDDALNKAVEMGEDKKFYEDEVTDGYRMVMYEYQVDVKDGAMIGDTVTGEMYKSDQKSEFEDWWSLDLPKNIDKDLSFGEIDISAGESTSVYILYVMPEDVKDYYEKVYASDDTEIWVHYVLEK